MLERENLIPVEDPLLQLQLLAAEVVRWKELLGDKVEELESWTFDDAHEHEDVRAVLAAYERSLEHAHRVLVDMARLGIDERLARITEKQAETLIRVIEAVLDSRELGLSRELRQTGRTILARELSAVTNARPSIGVAEHASS